VDRFAPIWCMKSSEAQAKSVNPLIELESLSLARLVL
jgi:hypothetical protein